ncbi:MAG: hypothetical protein M1823_006311, partial [Watsoniomyces obsoletus]
RTNTSSEEGKASSDEEDGNWNQIDDFNWLRNDQSSPNWKELSLDRRLDEALFTELLEAHESKKEVDVEGLLARTVDQFDSLPSSL